MPGRKRPLHLPLDHGNPAEQPLSSYRMSMLAHGFVDSEEPDRHEFVPDESGAMTYAVVRVRQRSSIAFLVIAVVLVVAIAVILLLA